MFYFLFILAILPIALILYYIYRYDKYEKEPLRLLLLSFLLGLLAYIPIVITELLLTYGYRYIFDSENTIFGAFYKAFIVAGSTEEAFKWVVFIWIIWRNKNFNEPFDGIVYAVFISLGFAFIENIFYVFQGGWAVGIGRALTAVPSHAVDGIIMGYFLGLAKFLHNSSIKYLLLSFLIPLFTHGLYDFILFLGRASSKENYFVTFSLLISFVLFNFIFFRYAIIKMKEMVVKSPFNIE